MERLLTVLVGILVLIATTALVSCDVDQPQSNRVQQANKAREAAESLHFTENAEIENIKKRLELTSSPGLIGYVMLINRVGQAVMYTPVKGKITSGGKRLTSPAKEWRTGGNGSNPIGPAPSDEGTWGSSGEYAYFWTPGGQYFQTTMDYVYSDKPFRLTEKPLIDLMPQAASK